MYITSFVCTILLFINSYIVVYIFIWFFIVVCCCFFVCCVVFFIRRRMILWCIYYFFIFFFCCVFLLVRGGEANDVLKYYIILSTKLNAFLYIFWIVNLHISRSTPDISSKIIIIIKK